MASSTSTTTNMTAIGIDLGSLHARLAIGPSSSSSSVPTMVSSAQGGRYTLALSTPDVNHYVEEEEDQGKKEQKEIQFVFGEAARRSLQRGGGGGKGEGARLVRHLSTVSVAGSLSDDYDEDEEEDDEFAAQLKKEQEETKEEAKLAAAAFFAHLGTLACDATSSTAGSLRVVLSVPNDASEELIRGIVQRTEEGISSLMTSAEKKQKKKMKDRDDNIVLAVLSDAAAVCVAHGLPKPPSSLSTPSSSPPSSSSSVNNVLVIDWGATGLSLTHLSHLGSSNILSTVRTHSAPQLSGTAIRSTLVKHCAQLFERKNRFPLGTLLESKKAKLKLENVCDETLRTLSKSNSVPVTVDGLYEGMDLNVVISRPRFDVLCHSVMKKAEEIMMQFAHVVPTTTEGENEEGESSKKRQRYDAVLLSGGVCQMISAKNLIEKIFPPSSSADYSDDNDETFPGKCWRGTPSIPPEEAIAMGCALHCSTLIQPQNYSLLYQKKGQNNGGGGGGQYLKNHPLLKDVPLSPVEICASCSLLTEPVVVIEEGTPLPANVTKTIMFSKETKETEDEEQNITLDIVQTKSGGDPTDNVVGKIEGSINKDTFSIELTLELTKEGKLIMAVNGGESVIV